jgi:hypothetical protein
MAEADADVPPPDEAIPAVASHRLASSAWSSGLSVADLASCLSLGLDPAGLVYGCAVMQSPAAYGRTWGGFPIAAGTSEYQETWRCPHGFAGGEHRMFGYNFEQSWVEQSWSSGFGLAYERMMEEAEALGAHGVIGVRDTVGPLARTGAIEFAIRGTAVVVPGVDRLSAPFSTYLSGQRLAKLLEAGFVPVAVVAAMSSVQMFAYCLTRYQLAGSNQGAWSGLSGVQSIAQVGRAQRAARRLARQRIRAQLGSDVLHGASVTQSDREIGESDLVIECVIKGTRVRRFSEAGPIPEPRPVVRLS